MADDETIERVRGWIDAAERVVVLTNLFRDFVRDGLSPLIQDAKNRVDPQSPEGEQLAAIHRQANADLSEVKNGIATGAVRDHRRVQDSLKQLEELAP